MRIVGLIELSKSVLKSSPHVALVVLDFGLQDKLGTNSKIVTRVASMENLHMLVVSSHPIQDKTIADLLLKVDARDRVRTVRGISKYVTGMLFLNRAKRTILSSRSSKGRIDGDQKRKEKSKVMEMGVKQRTDKRSDHE